MVCRYLALSPVPSSSASLIHASSQSPVPAGLYCMIGSIVLVSSTMSLDTAFVSNWTELPLSIVVLETAAGWLGVGGRSWIAYSSIALLEETLSPSKPVILALNEVEPRFTISMSWVCDEVLNVCVAPGPRLVTPVEETSISSEPSILKMVI